jgi:hypothetical protein
MSTPLKNEGLETTPRQTAQCKKAPLRFRKGEVRIPCSKFEDETIVKVCIADPEKPRLMCLECIMDNPDYVKTHKKSIISVEQYLSEIVDSFEGMRENK